MSLESNTKSHRIAICHMRSTNDPAKNRLQVADIVQKAKEKNANVSTRFTHEVKNKNLRYTNSQ